MNHYDNCVMLAPNGETLCTCSEKKLHWYLNRNLGEMVSEQPKTIMLNFNPKSYDKKECLEYYKQSKDNICVVCGECEDLFKRHIVPSDYRKHFPEHMKSHKCHDVLLVCCKCLHISVTEDDKLRKELAKRCGIPCVGFYDKEEVRKLRCAINNLNVILISKVRGGVPEGRIKKILQDLHFEDFSEMSNIEQIKEIIQTLKMRMKEEVGKGYNRPEIIVKHFENTDSLRKLELIWREHFINTMNPKYLPKLWSLRHSQNEDTQMDHHQ